MYLPVELLQPDQAMSTSPGTSLHSGPPVSTGDNPPGPLRRRCGQRQFRFAVLSNSYGGAGFFPPGVRIGLGMLGHSPAQRFSLTVFQFKLKYIYGPGIRSSRHARLPPPPRDPPAGMERERSAGD